jgi:predicted MFS family arabinose efflux permease
MIKNDCLHYVQAFVLRIRIKNKIIMNLKMSLVKQIAFAPGYRGKSESRGWAYLNKGILSRVYRIATSVFFFIAGLTFATWASRIPDIQNKLHLSDAGLGAVLFALPAGLMASLPLSGWLVARFGSRRLVIAGALLYPLVLVLLAVAGYCRGVVVSVSAGFIGGCRFSGSPHYGLISIWLVWKPYQHRDEYASRGS